MPDPVKKSGSILKKKIGPIPVPIALLIVAAVGYLAYRHYKNTASGTSGVSSVGKSAVDPNAIDPNTGLTYGAEGQAGQALGGASVNGTGAGGVGSALSLGDLEGLLATMQGFVGSTNYYYGGGGSGVSPTPTNTTGPGSGQTATVSPEAPASSPSPLDTRVASFGSTLSPTAVNQTATGPLAIGGGILTGAVAASPAAITGLPNIVSGSGPITVPIPSQGQASTGADIGAEIGADFSSLPTDQFGGPEPVVAAYTPPPATPSAPYTTPVTANPTGGSANLKQGVFSIH